MTLSMGMSKLGVFVMLKTSKVYFNANRSVKAVTFTIEMSAFLLPGLTEDVALARGEVCFVVVTGSNAIRSRWESKAAA